MNTFNNFNGVYDITNEKLSGVQSIGQHLIMSQIENNIKGFLDWGFLNIGGFINVYRSQNNIFNNDQSLLKPTQDPNYRNGQVWQTMRKDWVWEEDVSFEQPCKQTPSYYSCDNPLPSVSPSPSPCVNSIEPILISGIYINNNFYPINSNNGQFNYKIDYINSRVIFNNPISLTSVVQMEYSYRWVQIYNYDNARWWQQLQYKTDDNKQHFEQIQKGDFSILSNNRIQLPSIVIETVSRGQSSPFQLGDKSLIFKQELLLHIISENMANRNLLIDIIRLQQDKIIWLFDINTVTRNGVLPFNIDGTLNPNRIQYNRLVHCPEYRFLAAKLINIYASDVESFSPFLSESSVRLTVELISGINN